MICGQRHMTTHFKKQSLKDCRVFITEKERIEKEPEKIKEKKALRCEIERLAKQLKKDWVVVNGKDII